VTKSRITRVVRRQYTAEERAQLLLEVRSGGSVKEVAERHGLSPSLLYRWMHKPSKRGAPGFARLVVSKEVAESAVVVQVGCVAIRVERGFDSELLRDVVAALAGSQ
jgi:transposase-like protein